MEPIEDCPKTLLELEERFATDLDCLEYLCKLRWPNGFVCPACGSGEAWGNSRELFECQSCGRQTSVTAGTILHQTRKPIRLWLRAMWHIANQKYGANALGLQRVLGLGSYNTAWQWLHKLRRAMVRPNRERLTGVVEVDETYLGGKKPGKRGRGAEGKALIAIAVEDKGEEGIGRIRLQQIEDTSGKSLEGFITGVIGPGATVKTDDWNGYNGVRQLGYSHIIEPPNDLKLAHLVISLMKRWLLGTYQGAVRRSHLSYYLDEFTFRFNRRTSRYRGKLFYRLVQQAMLVDPAPLATLKGTYASFATETEEGFNHNM
jgi:transposase-like protein